jgi:hypothetical protein
MLIKKMSTHWSARCLEARVLEDLVVWCRTQGHSEEPGADTLFRRLKPDWIRRFALREALLPWVRANTGLTTFYPDELDVASTPRTLARHLAERIASRTESPIRPPIIPFSSDRVKEPTVFILNCPRSGSTLFRCMLMGHPSLYAPPELHLAEFASMRERERQFADAGQDWKTMGLVQTIMHLTGWSKWQAFHYLSHLTRRDVPVTEVYRLLHGLCPKPILVDKSPSISGHLQRIEEGFENPRYLFLTRHPYAAIESMTLNRVNPPFPNHTFAEAEQVWLEANSNIQRFLAKIPFDRWHRLSFEELVTRTEKTLRGVMDFLGLPECSSMADAYEGDRLQEGIGCINFPKRQGVEKELGDRWEHVRLPGQLCSETRIIAAELGYRNV